MPKTLFLIGTLPPPVTGQSVLFSILIRRLSQEQVAHRVINLADNSTSRIDGSFSWGRLISLVSPFLQSLSLLVSKRTTVYITIANSLVGFLKDLLFIVIAQVGSHRIILHCHGGDYGTFYSQSSSIVQWLIRKSIGSTDHLIILSEMFRRDFDFLQNSRVTISVVANCIDTSIPYHANATETVDSTYTPKSHNKSTRSVRILYLSNFIETKGYLVLLDAINILVNQHRILLSAHFCGDFVLAGSMISYLTAVEAEADFHSRIQRYGLADHVVFRGPVSGDEKHRELLEGDIFVLPTTYRNEAQPVAIIEALAYGCTVISTPHRAIPEMLDYGKAGILVESSRPDLIANQILKIQKKPALMLEYGHRARQQYLRNFHPDIHWDNMGKVLDV